MHARARARHKKEADGRFLRRPLDTIGYPPLNFTPTPTFFRVFRVPVLIVRVCPVHDPRQPKLARFFMFCRRLIHGTRRIVTFRFYELCVCASHNVSFRLLFFITEKIDFRFHGLPDRLNNCCSFSIVAIISILMPESFKFFITVSV